MVTKAQAKTVLDLISKFIPKSNYKKAKHTNGGKFKVAATGQPYVGFYIEDSKGNFIAGETPEEKGPDLVEIPQDTGLTATQPTGLLLEVLKRELTQNEIQQGTIKRYFTQDLYNSTIAEVLPESYFSDRQDTLRKNTLEIEWIVKGPADDRLFGKYPYQGAESKNRQTIQEANKTMPGISTYISDYRYLVQEAAINRDMSTSTSTGTEEPQTAVFTTSALVNTSPNTIVAGVVEVSNTTVTTTVDNITTTSTSTTYVEDIEGQQDSLENSRKANFDHKSDSVFPGPIILGTEVLPVEIVPIEVTPEVPVEILPPEPGPPKTLWNFTGGVQLDWPTNQSGYTLYNGSWNSVDDGYGISPIILPTTFYLKGVGSTLLFIGTNGYFTLGEGSRDIGIDLSTIPGVAANNKIDLWLEQGIPLDDGSTSGAWIKTFSNGSVHSISLLIYCSIYNKTTTPSSYIINFYRDTEGQYVETRLRYENALGQLGESGPYSDPDVYQPASTTSKVWRGDLAGLNWRYYGEGVVV